MLQLALAHHLSQILVTVFIKQFFQPDEIPFLSARSVQEIPDLSGAVTQQRQGRGIYIKNNTRSNERWVQYSHACCISTAHIVIIVSTAQAAGYAAKDPIGLCKANQAGFSKLPVPHCRNASEIHMQACSRSLFCCL